MTYVLTEEQEALIYETASGLGGSDGLDELHDLATSIAEEHGVEFDTPEFWELFNEVEEKFISVMNEEQVQ